MSISLQTAKQAIITALNDFDAELGRRASEILYNDDRLNIAEVTTAQTSMMACRPAGITIDDLKAMGMYMSDYEEKYGPHFTQQSNPEDYAIIDFEYDGTEGSFKYLAHELGHAIADDMQREQGRSFRDFSLDDLEQQAYFVQTIVADHVKQSTMGYNLDENLLKLSFDRCCQVQDANKAFDSALKASPNDRSRMISEIMAGRAERDVTDVAIVSKSSNIPQMR